MSEIKLAYCKYPEAYIYDPSDKKKKKKHLFWGDTVQIKGPQEGNYFPVYCRDETGLMLKDDLEYEPLLDIIFLDVGQGDSCIIVTPKDDKILIDAGMRDN